MLAALIASQSLVALVSAAPTPKEDFVVNLDRDFVEKHKANQAFLKGKCLIAKDPKNDCTPVPTNEVFYDALNFLIEHKSCKAITTKLEVTFELEGKKFDRFPIKAFCYVRARQCAELSQANFPRLQYLSTLRSYCIKSASNDEPTFTRSTTRQNTITHQMSRPPMSDTGPWRRAANPPLSDTGPWRQDANPDLFGQNSRIRIRRSEGDTFGRVTEQTNESIRIRLQDGNDMKIHSDNNFANGERIKIRDGQTGEYTYGRVRDNSNGDLKIRMDDGQEFRLKAN
jgi:hypothetical protein